MENIVITVDNLSKQYRLGTINHGTLRQDLQSWWARVRGKEDPNLTISSDSHSSAQIANEQFWAIKDISFNVKDGEILGIIGRNGAGKSTLLKILSRVTAPTSGTIKIHGRVASLLEVGTGFHPELTGRENIFLNGSILGMTKSEIKSKFDEIVDFAEIDQFIDTPVKRYSSGMYVRLAFAIAAHLDPEILIVDEVLAVGDVQFQKKCLGKMQDVSKEGRTVLFVSHNMGAIRELCTTAILLRDGKIVSNGNIDKVTSEYLLTDIKGGKLEQNYFSGTLKSILEFHHILLNNLEQNNTLLSPFKEITIAVRGICKKTIKKYRSSFSVYRDSVRLFSLHDTKDPEPLLEGEFESEVTIPAYFLRPGTYSIAIGGYRGSGEEWIYGTDIAMFSIIEEWDSNIDKAAVGIINLPTNGKRLQNAH